MRVSGCARARGPERSGQGQFVRTSPSVWAPAGSSGTAFPEGCADPGSGPGSDGHTPGPPAAAPAVRERFARRIPRELLPRLGGHRTKGQAVAAPQPHCRRHPDGLAERWTERLPPSEARSRHGPWPGPRSPDAHSCPREAGGCVWLAGPPVPPTGGFPASGAQEGARGADYLPKERSTCFPKGI